MVTRKLNFKKVNKRLNKKNKKKLTKKKVNKRLNKKGGIPKRFSQKEKINIHRQFKNEIAAQEYLTRQYHFKMHVGESISKQQRNLFEWLNNFIKDDFASNSHLTKVQYQRRIENIILQKQQEEQGTNTKLFTKGWMFYPTDE
jgi:hypothetical protein